MAVKIQSHFHLDLPANVDADGAPTACYKSRQRAPQPVVQTIVTTSWNATRHRSTIVDESADPVVHYDFKYRVIGTSTDMYTISGLLGRTAKFIDNYHPDTGEDHADYVKDVAVISVTEIVGIGSLWERVEFTLELQELT